jgi:hypothetical protein
VTTDPALYDFQVFLDESGNTGVNFLDSSQTVYVAAGWIVPGSFTDQAIRATEGATNALSNSRPELKGHQLLTPGLESVHFNAQHNFTLQYAVLLAPLRLDDLETTLLRKVRVVAAYLDILIHRRIWNWRAIRLLHDAVRHVPSDAGNS